jgi:hypothetical protein
MDRWLSVQIRIESSSTSSAYDGRLSVWIDNNNVIKPSHATAKDILIKTAGWGRDTCSGSHIVWGDGSFGALTPNDPSASVIINLADFEYDDEFDPDWSIGRPGKASHQTPTTPSLLPRLATARGLTPLNTR